MMKHLSSSFSRIGLATLVVAGAPVVATACGSAGGIGQEGDPVDETTGTSTGSGSTASASPDGDSAIAASAGAGASALPVLLRFEGDFDGTDFHIRPVLSAMAPSDTLLPTPAAADIGVSTQALLGTVASKNFPTGTNGTGSLIALEQMATASTIPAGLGPVWDPTVCGTVGGGNNVGTCTQIRLRNLFVDQDISRAYVRLLTLSPNATKGTTSVTIPAPAADNETSPGEAAFVTAGTGNGTWRHGLTSFASPVTNGPDRWWAFHGFSVAVPPKLNFSFSAEVVGSLMRPTIRASTANTTLDKTPFYTSNGTPGNAASGAQGLQMSGNGQYVVFSSSATNLLASATTSAQRVYRKDLTTGAVVVVSLMNLGGAPTTPAGCASNFPTISDNGRFVAFQSTCKLLSTTTTSPPGQQIYVRDITANTTKLLSADAVAPATTTGNVSSSFPRISGNGLFVVYHSAASNLLPAGQRPSPRAFQDVYRYALSTNTLARANVPNGQSGPAATWPNQAQLRPDISSNGRYVVYETLATNLLPAPNLWFNTEIAFFDFSGTTAAHVFRMSGLSTGGEPGQQTNCTHSSISPDGTAVGFLCTVGASNSPFVTTPTTTAGIQHVYVRAAPPAAASTIEMIDKSPDGTTEASSSAVTIAPAFSSTGRLVAYGSAASNLLRSTGCTPGCIATSAIQQLYVFDRVTTDPTLDRAFGVSLVHKKVAAVPNSALLAVSALTGGFTLAGPVESVFAAYSSTASGTDWNQMPSNSAQVFVSPVGDPQFE